MGAAFLVVLLVCRSVLYAVAGEVTTGKEPVSVRGKKTSFISNESE